MANLRTSRRKNGKYLWHSLLGLGFQPDVAVLSLIGKANFKHLNLGSNMFDKPNKDAFYLVTHFLLEKLNPSRFNEAYRHCWPVLDHKQDAEFRKVTCAWLREIMDETANAGSKVVASLFLSPGGPKFTSLMLLVAKHVMLQEMKTFTTDEDWVPEAVAVPASSLDMAVKRFNLVRAWFLKGVAQQDLFFQEYQRRAQHCVKSMREIKAEGAKYDELLERQSSDSAQDEASVAEKRKKVRSLWSDIERMFSAIKEEQNVVESVVKGDVDKYILDGTNRDRKIPACLLERIESFPHEFTSGKMYEDNKLNPLFVLELMNHALQLLKEERCLVSSTVESRINHQLLLEKSQQMSRVLQDLQVIRQKISKREIPKIRCAIRELEADWDKRWEDVLKDVPLVSFLNENPSLGFLSPIAPLSFEPATEATYKSSVFSQYPAKLQDETPAESKSIEEANPYELNQKSCPAALEASPSLAQTVETRANTSLDWLFDFPPSPPQKPAPAPPTGAAFHLTSNVASVRKMKHENEAPVKTKTEILDLECDNLADQFADAITMATPSESRVKSLDLESLLNTLHRDPFSTKKQLPRTPVSLIMDVKSSWRKAVEEDEAEKSCQSPEDRNLSTQRLGLSRDALVSPSGLAHALSFTIPTPTSRTVSSTCQQDALQKSSLLWNTSNTEGLDSPSGTGSSAVQFSLDHETLPEMASYDSLMSEDDDEAVDMRSELEEGRFTPSQPVTAEHLGLSLQTDCRSPMESVRTTQSLLSDYKVTALEKRAEPAASSENTEKVFSLDLDSLRTPSPQNKNYSLPKLITFSPLDDM